MPRRNLLRAIAATIGPSLAGRRARLTLLTSLVTGLVACSGNDEPPLASGGTSGSAAGSSTAGTSGSAASAGGTGGAGGLSGGGGGGAGMSGGATIEPSFNTLKGIIQTSCFGGLCHDLPENPLKLTVNDNLYTILTTHMTEHCGLVVKPGFPQESALVRLLKGPCGDTDRMPYGKCFEDGDEGCIAPERIAAIEKWIANGAPQ
jgi:hypothetical protein